MSARLTALGTSLGMDGRCGLWSLRKDACEGPAAAGNGAEAARVLGHRRVNSRTMDRVYRADLRTHDLGQYWTGRPGVNISEPLSSISAERVPAAAAIVRLPDMPADAAERLRPNKYVEIAVQQLNTAAAAVWRYVGEEVVDKEEARRAAQTERGARALSQLTEAERALKLACKTGKAKAKATYNQRVQE